MKPTINPFEARRRPGVAGKVISSGCNVMTVRNSCDISVDIYTAELLPGVWDFGYLITGAGISCEKKFPGEGAGWFVDEVSARLFALGELRKRFDVNSEIGIDFKEKITLLQSPGLFD